MERDWEQDGGHSSGPGRHDQIGLRPRQSSQAVRLWAAADRWREDINLFTKDEFSGTPTFMAVYF